MRVSKEELVAVLAQFNPWWRGEAIAALPIWRRAAFRELQAWMTQPPAPRAVLLSGARQIGKTTLLLQANPSAARGPTRRLFQPAHTAERECVGPRAQMGRDSQPRGSGYRGCRSRRRQPLTG